MTDDELIRSVLDGNQRNFRLIVEKYSPRVFRTVLGFVHQREEAEEITQDCFLKAYNSLSSFSGKSAFSTWLYRITVNTALNAARKKKREQLMGDLSAFFQFSSPEKNAGQKIEAAEGDRMVQQALDKLPQKQRVAFILSKFEEFSQKEIAEIMGTSEGAVEQLIFRARLHLKKELEKRRKV
jgi:RNA polymerase sigma-70 factor (ECF subfamily)